MTVESTSAPAVVAKRARAELKRIGVAVNGFPGGEDAAALGAALARNTGAELMLLSVLAQPLAALLSALDIHPLERQAEDALASLRERLGTHAEIAVQADTSVPRTLRGLAIEHDRDVVIVGSSRHGEPGRVRIGKRTRQLLESCECAVAVAPWGLRERADRPWQHIAVGYDGGPESEVALSVAASLARRAGAQLEVRVVVDDRLPALGVVALGSLTTSMLWEEAVQHETNRLTERAWKQTKAVAADGRLQVDRGRPGDTLLEVSRHVDLLVIGSRRWGNLDRVLLGSTGELLMHDAACPVLVVPRPEA